VTWDCFGSRRTSASRFSSVMTIWQTTAFTIDQILT
jgi:hypothetical protein